MPANMNLVRLSKQLEQLKGEVRARVDRSRDDENEPNSDVFAIKNPDIEKSMGVWIKEQTAEAKRLQGQIDDYLLADGAMQDFDGLVEMGKQPVKSVRFPTAEGSRVDIVHELFDSEEFKSMRETGAKGMQFNTQASLKELFAGDSNAANTVNVESVRNGDFVMLPRTRVTLLDIIPQLPTTERIVKYDVETVDLSNVDEVEQGGPYLQSQFQINEAQAAVVKIGTFIQVSEELLEDEPEMRARLNTSLTNQMLRRVQSTVVGGVPIPAAEYVGTPTDISAINGFLDLTNTTGINYIDTHDLVATGEKANEYEMVERAVEQVYRIGEADSDAVVMNSQDWRNYVTLQTTTGAFVARGALMGTDLETTMQIAGLPVILCNALASGTVLVGAFRDYSCHSGQAVRPGQDSGIPERSWQDIVDHES